MIIKGKSITGPEALGPYLENAEANERVSILEIKGTVAQDLIGALIEMDAYAAGTRCEKPLYHGKISPEPPYRLTPEQVMESVDAMEERLGLTGQPRVVVMHEKLGRQHFHPVWARIDLEKMRAVPDSHNYRKHEEVSRDLERRFGHPRVQGAHAERDGVERPDRSPTRSELAQQEKTGISRKAVKRVVTDCFRSSDNVGAFRAAVEDNGYLIANGDRRDFVIVDHAGGIHSLAKMIEGMRAAELREFMKGIDRKTLPSATMAQDAQLDKAAGRTSALDERKWNDELAKNAINKDDQRIQVERTEKERFREAAIKWEAEQNRMRKERKEARSRAKRAKSYGQGDGYVNQSKAVLQDHRHHQKVLKKILNPLHPDDHKLRSVQGRFRDHAKSTTGYNGNQRTENHLDPIIDHPHGPANERRDFNEEADRRYKAMRITLYGEDGFEKSYFADEACLRSEEARARKEREAAHQSTFDTPLGQNAKPRDYNEIADKQYKAMRITLYGENGFEKSYFADEARLRHDEEQERKREMSRNAPSAKPLAEKQKGRSIWESDEEAIKRAQRLLNEEKWEARSDNEELDPNRQKKALGGGRTRSR